MPQHRTGTILVLIATFFQVAVGIFDYVLTVRKNNGILRSTVYMIMFVTLEALLIFFGRQYFKSLDELARVQREFDVRKCECSVEHDHPMLLKEINRFMKSSSSADDGIQRFNELVKRNLRTYAPFKGFRSVLVVSYIPCFILGGINIALRQTDSWLEIVDGWAAGFVDGSGHIWSFKYITYYLYSCLVAFPMLIYLFLLMLKVMWWVEKFFDLRNPVLIFLLYTAFLAFDVFVPVRIWIWVNGFSNLAAVLISNWVYAFQTSPFSLMPMLFVFTPPFGFGWFWDSFLPVKYTIPVWGRVFVIIWIVVSSIGTYWLFESAYLQSMRLKIWGWVRKRMPFSKDISNERFLDLNDLCD